VIVCSDGLPTMLNDERIASIVREDPSPDAVCERLVQAANAAGGEDNITVVAFEVVDGEPPERPTKTRPEPAEAEAQPPAPTQPQPIPEDASRHGAGKGSRWPALLFLAAIALIGVLALWWSIGR
jgi:hypothetical protein